MLKKIPFVLACVASLLFVACSKEESIDTSGGNALLVGNWKFLGLHVKSESIVELTGPGLNTKTVSPSEYFTKDNMGSVTITANQFIGTDIAYSIDTSFTGYTYEDGVLTDSLSVPFAISLPPVSSASPYKVIGSDSLYFPAGGFVSGGSGSIPTQPTGAKFTLQNDILTITSQFYFVESQSDAGMTMKQISSATTVTTLQKL